MAPGRERPPKLGRRLSVYAAGKPNVASHDRNKYGNIIVRDLLRRGYDVRPVHPREHEVAGLPCVPNVAAIAGPVAIANLVVPPAVALEVVGQLDPRQVAVVWLQPGSFDDKVLQLARRRFAHVVAGECILVVARWA